MAKLFVKLKISEAERQRRARQRVGVERQGLALRAMSIGEFCERYGPHRTKAYEELKSGRLRGRKIGKRTIITEDDAEDWLRRLPVFEAAR
jgi:Helix-turn-helix domain